MKVNYKWHLLAVRVVCVNSVCAVFVFAHMLLHMPIYCFDWEQQVDICEGTLDEGEQGYMTRKESSASRLANQLCIAEYKLEHLHKRTWGKWRGGRHITSHGDLADINLAVRTSRQAACRFSSDLKIPGNISLFSFSFIAMKQVWCSAQKRGRERDGKTTIPSGLLRFT